MKTLMAHAQEAHDLLALFTAGLPLGVTLAI